jgi:DNA-binding CsgD family transcriptional regulator
MPRLSGSDFDGVLTVLHEAGQVEGPMPFPEPVLEALHRLVRCEVVSYHERVVGHPAAASAGEQTCSGVTDIGAAYIRYQHQDPLAPSCGARKVSDFFSRREFHRSELYQHVFRPLGVEDTLRLWLDPQHGSSARLDFDRPRRDFRERDREVLNVLHPHLSQFRRTAEVRQCATPPSSTDTDKLTSREHKVLELVATGKTNAEIASTLWVSPLTVRRHLENIYKKLGVHTRTAAVAVWRNWPDI